MDRLRTLRARLDPGGAERVVSELELPEGLLDRLRRSHPAIGERTQLVELGLRDWFVACAYRRKTQLGMPSQAVDRLWHEFTLHTDAYERFCRAAYGVPLQYRPDAHFAIPPLDTLDNTVAAWDRSRASLARDSVLWDLDQQLGLPGPKLVLDRHERARVRAAVRSKGVRSRMERTHWSGDFGGGDGGGE